MKKLFSLDYAWISPVLIKSETNQEQHHVLDDRVHTLSGKTDFRLLPGLTQIELRKHFIALIYISGAELLFLVGKNMSKEEEKAEERIKENIGTLQQGKEKT
jgi:hypothetical protein